MFIFMGFLSPFLQNVSPFHWPVTEAQRTWLRVLIDRFMYSLTAVGICAACAARAAIVCKESGDKSLISIVGI